jgi:thymidylate synthase (FAD)
MEENLNIPILENEEMWASRSIDEHNTNVTLLSYSQPTSQYQSLGIDDAQELIAYCARVSNPSNQLNTETSEKLIQYLVKHQHWSPLEMVSACIEITTTRDIARQILRHRSFSFQEFSQRYADPTRDLSFVIREARLQDSKNRQNSIEIKGWSLTEQNLIEQWKWKQQEVIAAAEHAYEWAIKNGIAKEQARAVLPEGLTVSRLYMNGTLRSWIHYIQLRAANGTQKEHMLIAKQCAEVIAAVFPMAKQFTE